MLIKKFHKWLMPKSQFVEPAPAKVAKKEPEDLGVITVSAKDFDPFMGMGGFGWYAQDYAKYVLAQPVKIQPKTIFGSWHTTTDFPKLEMQRAAEPPGGYTREWFQNFFSQIPEDQWAVGNWDAPGGGMCTLMHLLTHEFGARGRNFVRPAIQESRAVKRLSEITGLTPQQIVNRNDMSKSPAEAKWAIMHALAA